MRKCSKCVLPESTPNITFDTQGGCNYCSRYQKLKYKGESELIKVLDSFRNISNKYDCIVTISGGRDSIYTLLKVVKDYRMRVLAVNYENPYTHPQAKLNMEEAVKSLGVDMIKLKPKNKMFEKSFRNNLITWLQKPSLSMLPMLCIACRTMDWEIYWTAKKYKIHCIVNGANPMQDASFIRELSHLHSNTPFYQSIVKALPLVLVQIFRNPGYLRPQYIPITIKSFIVSLINAIGPKQFGFNISTIGFFYFIKWNEQEVLSRIESELKWDYPHGMESTQRFDCPIAYFKNFIYWRTMGMSKVDDYYAKIVRENLMTRQEALQIIQEKGTFDLDKIQQFLEETGIEKSFIFEQTMNLFGSGTK